jgi:hypothetical protein
MKLTPIFTLLTLALCAHAGRAAENKPAAAPEPYRGALFSGTIRAREKVNGKDAMTAMRGLAVTFGAERRAHVCFDADLMRLSLAWTGDFLEFGSTQTKIEWPPPPQVKGTALFSTKAAPGWYINDGSPGGDSRTNKQGPLPADWAKYRGLYRNGEDVIFSYTVGKTAVLEMPRFKEIGGRPFFTRTIEVGPSQKELVVGVASISAGEAKEVRKISKGDGKRQAQLFSAGLTNALTVALSAELPEGEFVNSDEGAGLVIPPREKAVRFTLIIGRAATNGPEDTLPVLLAALGHRSADLAALAKGGAPKWEPLTTQGTVSTNSAPYVVDHLVEPEKNPWNAKMYFGGFDFFPDGRAALCTFHGDVWVVSGIDDKLARLTWKRYATGLFQPLGVKVVEGKVYVTGRDQITRLHDLNGDGEADFYENFNNDTVVTANYHEFCLDLQTDSGGNFYFAKGAPWPPTVESPHQGTLIKVSRDGAKMEVIATGLRAPNGMGIGPRDEITVSDNEGHWIPTSKLNLVKPGGFYGMMQTAHRTPAPTAQDLPLCWLPKGMDNSSGGQVWVGSKKWGPFDGHLLFMSYGKGTLFHVMPERVDGVDQAGMVQFPLKFPSGTMRARFHPKDGQLYVSGLRGWQTSGVRDGAFNRVRYTGAPVQMPLAMAAQKEGVKVVFTAALDASAANAENWSAEQWNYKWSANYGSPEFSVMEPEKKGHDKLTIKSVRLAADRKSAFVEIADLRPCDQLKLKFNLKGADGTPIAQEIYSTIHKLGDGQKLGAK